MPYKNIKEQLKHNREYKRLNKNKILKQAKIYYNKNKKRLLKEMKKYRKINRLKRNLYEIKQRNFNIHNRILHNLRTRIIKALKGNPKLETTVNLTGCSIKKLKQHIENQFKFGMFWSNYGVWHIDHIRPCASFNLSKKSEQKKCFHYTNLQPLWSYENLTKGVKYGKN